MKIKISNLQLIAERTGLHLHPVARFEAVLDDVLRMRGCTLSERKTGEYVAFPPRCADDAYDRKGVVLYDDLYDDFADAAIDAYERALKGLRGG